MRCRENPTFRWMFPTFFSHVEWCDLMWGSGHTYCFRSHHGYDSQSYLTEMVELANAFCEGWEGQTGNAMSQLKIWDKIASQKLVRMRNNIFQVQPRHLVTKAWQAGRFMPGIPAIHAWQIACTQLWAAVRGDSQMSTWCLASLQRSESHPPA